MNQSERYPRYRAPSGDGEVLCRPAWENLPALVDSRADDSEAASVEIAEKSLRSLRAEARSAFSKAAQEYTLEYTDARLDTNASRPIIATGHQPGLVHPGVWLKNFAAAKLAQQVGGVAINLIIDSDLCRSSGLDVPTGSVDSPRVEKIPFDKALAQVPYEERDIADRELWASFGRRATDAISPLVPNPLLKEWWPDVAIDSKERNLGRALSGARHRLELSWESTTLELPQSELCRSEAFHSFAAHLLSRASKFRDVYNSALDDYRRAHRLRNLAQPVPDLHQQDEWIEAPFWIWSSDDPTRRPLFVNQNQNELLITDRDKFTQALPVPASGTVDALANLEMRGFKIRTRALLTTMYARLILSDLFIHGIGGAKYDQVTDQICQRFFGITPPPYATLTGTLRLPIPHPPTEVEQEQELRQALRHLRYHPERELIEAEIDSPRISEYRELVAEKSRWVHTPKTHENCAERHAAIYNTNRALQAFTSERVKHLEVKLETLQRQLRVNRILESREYSFCLFPREKIRDFVLDFPSRMA